MRSKQVLTGLAGLLECLCPRWAHVLNDDDDEDAASRDTDVQ